jgi:hypothetical protein
METGTTDAKANGARKSAPGNACLVYVPRGDATPEGELAALVAVYKFVLERHDERKKGPISKSGGEDTRSPSSQERHPVAGSDE